MLKHELISQSIKLACHELIVLLFLLLHGNLKILQILIEKNLKVAIPQMTITPTQKSGTARNKSTIFGEAKPITIDVTPSGQVIIDKNKPKNKQPLFTFGDKGINVQQVKENITRGASRLFVKHPKTQSAGNILSRIKSNLAKANPSALVKNAANYLAKQRGQATNALPPSSKNYMKGARVLPKKATLKMSGDKPYRVLTSPQHLTGKSLGIPQSLLHPRYPKGTPEIGGQFMRKGSNDYIKAVIANIRNSIDQGKISNAQGLVAIRQIAGRGKPIVTPSPKSKGFTMVNPPRPILSNYGNSFGFNDNRASMIDRIKNAGYEARDKITGIGSSVKAVGSNAIKALGDKASSISGSINKARAETRAKQISANKARQAAERKQMLNRKKLADRTAATAKRKAMNEKRLEASRRLKSATKNLNRFARNEDLLGRTSYSFK